MRGYDSGSFAFGAVERIANHGFGGFEGFFAFVAVESDHGDIIWIWVHKNIKK